MSVSSKGRKTIVVVVVVVMILVKSLAFQQRQQNIMCRRHAPKTHFVKKLKLPVRSGGMSSESQTCCFCVMYLNATVVKMGCIVVL